MFILMWIILANAVCPGECGGGFWGTEIRLV